MLLTSASILGHTQRNNAVFASTPKNWLVGYTSFKPSWLLLSPQGVFYDCTEPWKEIHAMQDYSVNS